MAAHPMSRDDEGRDEGTMVQGLEKEIEEAINRHSAENGSNTPDFILAQYLLGCLAAFNQAVQQRETWYGRDARPRAGVGAAPVALRGSAPHLSREAVEAALDAYDPYKSCTAPGHDDRWCGTCEDRFRGAEDFAALLAKEGK